MAELLNAKEQKAITALIEKIFAALEIDGSFTMDQSDDTIEVMMETSDTGMIIGYHGEVLESLQLILSLSVAKKIGRFIRVSVEVDDYKKNRTEYLEKLAIQTKDKALSEQEEQVLSNL